MTGLQRTVSALAGGVVEPPPCGVTFIAPDALPGHQHADDPAAALARAFVDARLDFAFVPSWECWATALCGLLHDVGIAVMWVVPGVLWPTLEAVGVAEGLRAIGRDPGSLAPRIDAAADAMLEAVAHGAGLHVDAIVVAEDLAAESGLLVSPDFASGQLLPQLTRAVAAASRADLPALLHSDGDVSVLLPVLAEAGFAGLHAGGLGGEAFARLHAAARREGLAVVGGLSARMLSGRLPAAVLAGTRLAILARTGGLLVADDGGMTTPEEWKALLAALAATQG